MIKPSRRRTDNLASIKPYNDHQLFYCDGKLGLAGDEGYKKLARSTRWATVKRSTIGSMQGTAAANQRILCLVPASASLVRLAGDRWHPRNAQRGIAVTPLPGSIKGGHRVQVRTAASQS